MPGKKTFLPAVRAFGRTYNQHWLIERHGYLTPTEAKQKAVLPGQAVRLGGLVLAGTMHYDPASRLLTFAIGDGTTNVAVVGDGAPPALLKEGAGAVVEGAFAQDGTFHATTVLAKHDERYAPPSPGETPAHQTSP